MKTEKSKPKVEVAVFKDMNSNTTVKQGKKLAVGMKTEAFGDKENLKCRLPFTGDSVKPKLPESEETSKDKKIKVFDGEECSKEKISKKITAEDLTSEAGPSETYWEVLAERRRKALEEALIENSTLHEEMELLRKENETLKQALSEATDVIDVLNEIVAEEELEGDEPSESVSNKNDGEDSESKPPKSPIKSAFGDESSFLNDSFDSVKE